MMRCTLTLIVVVAAACLAAADYTVPIYSHHGKVSSVTQLNLFVFLPSLLGEA